MTTPNVAEAEDPHVTRATARLGMVLQDKWTLDAVLGVGGMAAVSAAKMTTPNVAEAEDPHVTRATARLGMVLQDKWTLDAVLGVGGMAAVYAATHRNGKRVAVKVLHADMGRDAEVK